MQAFLELRHADDPQHLLGYLPIPIGLEVKAGAVVVFDVGRPEVLRPHGQAVPLQLRVVIGEYWRPVAPGMSASALAYRVGSVPLPLLRRIPGFLEAIPAVA